MGSVPGEGVFLGKRKDSVWEDWGTLGKIRGITTPLKNPIIIARSSPLPFNEGIIGCTPNNVLMVFIVFSRDSSGL